MRKYFHANRACAAFPIAVLMLLLFLMGCAGDPPSDVQHEEEARPGDEYDLYEMLHVNDKDNKTMGISREELFAFFPDLPIPEEFMGVPFFCANVSTYPQYVYGETILPLTFKNFLSVRLYYMRDNFEGGVYQVMILSGEYKVSGSNSGKRQDLSDSPERFVHILEETGRVLNVVEYRDGYSYSFSGSINTIADAEAHIAHDEVQAFIGGVADWLREHDEKPSDTAPRQADKTQQTISEPELGLSQMMVKGNQRYGGTASAISYEELLSYFPDLPVPAEFMGCPFNFASVRMASPMEGLPFNKIVDIALLPENVDTIIIGYISDEDIRVNYHIQFERRNPAINRAITGVNLSRENLSDLPERYLYIDNDKNSVWQAIECRGDIHYGFSGTSIVTASDAEPFLDSDEVQSLIEMMDKWLHK